MNLEKLKQELDDLERDYKNLREGNYNENYRIALKRELDKAKEDILEKINQLIK